MVAPDVALPVQEMAGKQGEQAESIKKERPRTSTTSTTASSTNNSPTAKDWSEGRFQLPDGSLIEVAADGMCGFCGEQATVEGLIDNKVIYMCEQRHNYLVCSDKCAKKFTKENTKAVQPSSATAAKKRQLLCPSCQSAMSEKAPPKPPKKAAKDSKRKDSAEDKPTLLTGGKGTVERQECKAQLTVGLTVSDKVVEDMLKEEELPDDPETVAAFAFELEAAKNVVAEAKAKVADFEAQIKELGGQANRKQRNEVNQQLLSLKNSEKFMAAELLLRDPDAEHRRRKREQRRGSEMESKNIVLQKVVRQRLVEALERIAHAETTAKKGHGKNYEQILTHLRDDDEKTWSGLLCEGTTAGLSEDDEPMVKVAERLDAARARARIVAEQVARKAEAAARKAEADRIKHEEEEAVRKEEERLQRVADAAILKETHRLKREAREAEAAARQEAALNVDESACRGTPKNSNKWEDDPRYKTELCFEFDSGSCRQGANCWYAHGINDLRVGENWQQRQHRQQNQQWKRGGWGSNGWTNNGWGYGSHGAQRGGRYGRQQRWSNNAPADGSTQHDDTSYNAPDGSTQDDHKLVDDSGRFLHAQIGVAQEDVAQEVPVDAQ